MHIEDERRGNDWVVLKLKWSAEGKDRGASLTMKIVGAYRIEGGKIAKPVLLGFRRSPRSRGLRE